MSSPGPKKLATALILLLFFCSGLVALTYQVVWARMMMHIFGSTALAVGTVLAGFMAGLAVGSWAGGKAADRSRNGLRLYAWLEFGIAVAAALVHFLLHHMDSAYPAIHGLFADWPLALGVVRFALVFLLVLAPTLMMGATLPVLTRYLVRQPALVGRQLSSLYAANTFGAVCGALLTGFFLIGRYGIHVPVYAAIAGNALIACAAWLASTRVAAPADCIPASSGDNDVPPGPATPIVRLVVFALGVSGLTSFAYEIYWTRSLVFVLGNSTYAMTTMLAAFLTGIGLGGYLVRFLFRARLDRIALFGWVQILLGTTSAVALPVLFGLVDRHSIGQLLVEGHGQSLPLLLSGFGVSFAVMLIPAVMVGMTFPLAGQIASPGLQNTGSTVGRVYAANTLGNVLGALLPGAFLLSWLGIQRGILAMALLNIAMGCVILLWRIFRIPAARPWRRAAAALPVAALLLASQVPLRFEFPFEGELARHETLFYHEGPLATTKVSSDPLAGEKLMAVDGIVIGGTGNTEFKQLLLAHLPKLLLDDVSSELSVGIGSGILLGESLLHERVRHVTGVEIEPGVVSGAEWFREENHAVLQDPGLRVVADDIGNFLRTTADSYQVISADEKTADEYASNGFSYSRDYYRLLLQHLAADGLVAQWVPTTLPPRQYRMVLKTFASVFPHVQLWHFLPAWRRGPFNTILIGSRQPVEIDPQRIEARFAAQPAAFDSLRRYGITSADALLLHFIAADDVVRRAVEDAEINSLDHPRYEFYRPWDYAADRAQMIIENYDLLMALRREAFPAYLAALSSRAADSAKLRRGFAAEFQYLAAFRRFLGGMPLDENYRLFDLALEAAPWNDSLRARIYAQYSYLAATRSDPAERALLMRRAQELYPEP
jgi:spermidine synthase